jgi:hypothetical protein
LKKSWLCTPNSSSAWHIRLSGGAGDSARCPRLAGGAALGKRRSCTSKIHRSVRWCTGLSGESSATNSSLSEKEKGDVAQIHWTVRWCTRLSSEPTAPAANGRPCDHRATRGQLQRSAGCTGLSGAPSGPKDQRSAAPDLEGDRASDCYSGCPVVHQTVTTRQKARLAFQVGLQRLLAALGL